MDKSLPLWLKISQKIENDIENGKYCYTGKIKRAIAENIRFHG